MRESAAITEFAPEAQKTAQITKIIIQNKHGTPSGVIPISSDFFLRIQFEIRQPIRQVAITAWFYAQGELLLSSSDSDTGAILVDYAPGTYETTIRIPAFLFNVGQYFFAVRILQPFVDAIDYRPNIGFEISDENNPISEVYRGHHMGKVACILEYQTKKLTTHLQTSFNF